MAGDNIHGQLRAILQVLGLHFDSLFSEDFQESGKDRERVIAWLYRILDTLDSKTSHLLRFAALLLAAQSFLAGILVRRTQTPGWISVTVLILLLTPLVTAVFGLSVFRIQWPFLGYVQEASDENGAKNQIKNEMQRLAQVCAKRVEANKRTFFGCCLSAGAFVVTLALATVVVLR